MTMQQQAQQPQNPVVIEVTRQPEPTPEISYVGLLGSAGTLAILIFLAALAFGAIVGGVIVWRKKQMEKGADVAGPSHTRLQF